MQIETHCRQRMENLKIKTRHVPLGRSTTLGNVCLHWVCKNIALHIFAMLVNVACTAVALSNNKYKNKKYKKKYKNIKI